MKIIKTKHTVEHVDCGRSRWSWWRRVLCFPGQVDVQRHVSRPFATVTGFYRFGRHQFLYICTYMCTIIFIENIPL